MEILNGHTSKFIQYTDSYIPLFWPSVKSYFLPTRPKTSQYTIFQEKEN